MPSMSRSKTTAPEYLLKSRIGSSTHSSPPRRRGPGTGLGLDISYNIVVSKHRGDITVTSEPGRTIFTVMLLKELRE